MKDTGLSFSGLIDLASASLGGRALDTNDDFFAGMQNLLRPGRGSFTPDKYTDRGKWMDGWESRRKRGPGHDWCIIELGAPGMVYGVDIDTNHFLGNHPPFASLDGLRAPRGTPSSALEGLEWTELLPQAPLRPGSQNLFVAERHGAVSHVRLNIFPDGGVARLRIYGRVEPDWSVRDLDEETQLRVPPGAVDLAAVRNGALPLACSDAFFSPMEQLLLPGRAETMGGGWETRRKRGPGHDWIIVRLAARGRPQLIEVDTNHFKGNFPDRFSIEALAAPAGAGVTDLMARTDWVTWLPQLELAAHTRHFFDQFAASGSISHLRLNIYPDGGVSRLRVWGERAEVAPLGQALPPSVPGKNA
ncbi:MAG: allantoicase [Deltaproteobacteria bacterium]